MSALVCLPSLAGGGEAVRYFRRPRWGNLFGALAVRGEIAVAGVAECRSLPYLERLWMPAYAVCVEAELKQSISQVWTSVDGWTGQCSLFDCIEYLREIDTEEDCFTPRIGEAEARDAARNGLLRYAMSQRGQSRKPIPKMVLEVRPYHYPVWVLYFKRRGKYLDIKVLDGFSGKPGGPKMRIAVLDAFVAQHKASAE